jgi:hypothetical protein
MPIMATTITTAEVATELGTDPRTLRKFLRATTPKESQPGKGARYSLKGDARSLASMKKKFIAWTEAEAAKRAESTESDNED